MKSIFPLFSTLQPLAIHTTPDCLETAVETQKRVLRPPWPTNAKEATTSQAQGWETHNPDEVAWTPTF